MKFEAQNQPEPFELNFTYEVLGDSKETTLVNLKNISPVTMDSTSANFTTYKYWNPATAEEQSKNSHEHKKSVDQLIGEFRRKQ
jgi:hypothetical protein